MEYDNINRGVIFVEESKESDKHPDFKGSINIEGQEYWISGWKKKSKSGKKFISISADPKEGRKSQQPEKDTGGDW